ncbi:MAG TPA: aldehyde dehydrogenase family protein [Streptosporangiaceae bacterium]|jgi:NADP-dependent aldehyde dehydrogenase
MIQGYDPRTGQPVGEPVPETAGADMDAIVSAAAGASESWAEAPPDVRAAALDAVAAALDERVGELAAVADAETALGMTRLTGEVARTSGQLRLFAGVLRDGGYLDVASSPASAGVPGLRRVNRAIGPVAVFAASNFPLAFSVAGGDTASALAAGCPVIVKAHEAHPQCAALTAEIVAGALREAGAPGGAFALVHGVDAGVRLLRHPLVAAAGFTGSARGGLALAQICAQRPVPIPFYAEMGSVNPVVVLPAAAVGRTGEIAAGYAASLTLGAGQFCTNPGLLFIPGDGAELTEAIVAAVSAASGGPMLSARIHEGFVAAIADLAARSGVRPLAAGQPGEGPWAGTPQVFQASLDAFAAGLPALAEERFGPAGLVVTYRDVDALVLTLGLLGGNLAGCVHLDDSAEADIAAARQVIAVLSRTVGRIVVNGWPTGVAVTPAQHHGGPWPATTAPAHTSVGAAAIRRWLTPVVYQDCPPALLPAALGE